MIFVVPDRNAGICMCAIFAVVPPACHVFPVFKSSAKNNKGFEKYLSSPVSILALELEQHPDKKFTHYLLTGLQQGFDPGLESLPESSFVCNNLQSALAEPDIVDSLLKKENDSKFMIGPFTSPPFAIYHINPIGIATRKKRIIIDLSAPLDCPVPSINSLIPLPEFSLHYHDVDQAIHLIKTASRGAWLAKIDITSAFWHLFCRSSNLRA